MIDCIVNISYFLRREVAATTRDQYIATLKLSLRPGITISLKECRAVFVDLLHRTRKRF
jgi:hypothetical protein